MIAGIRKLWISHYSDLLTKGYSVNNNRLNLFVKNGWVEVFFSRDTAQLSSINKIDFYTNQIKYSHFNPTTLSVDYAKKLQNKRIIAVALLDNGNTVIVGVENPLTFTFKYNTGSNAFDGIGYSVELNSNSKVGIEIFDINKLPLIINTAKWLNVICVKELAQDIPIYAVKWINPLCVKELSEFNIFLSAFGINPGFVSYTPSGPYYLPTLINITASQYPPITDYFHYWEIKNGNNWEYLSNNNPHQINISENTYIRAVYLNTEP